MSVSDPAVLAATLPFADQRHTGGTLRVVLTIIEHVAAAVLAIDVLVVFFSVIFRYFLHHPFEWAEEVARALMVGLVVLGAASVLARGGHSSLEILRSLFPERWRAHIDQLTRWIILAVSAGLFYSAIGLMMDSAGHTTPLGLPRQIFTVPLVIGAGLMTLFAVVRALEGPRKAVWQTFTGFVVVIAALLAFNMLIKGNDIPTWLLLAGGFFGSLIVGVPIAFALAFTSLLYFVFNPSMPILVYSQQVMAGTDNFVLLAIPFFVLAGLAMEVNGMSTRLIELLVRMFGRLRGGLNVIMVVATAFFSGLSGSKLADIAAVGSILMPAVRRTKQDANDAAGLLAATAVMSETIPPCINVIIFGFVANVSIGGLFLAGLVPAALLAMSLIIVAVIFGTKVDPEEAFPVRRSLWRLIGGAMVAVLMVFMIGRGITTGIATSAEISAFAVVYAIVVGGLVFRELTLKKIVHLFVRSAAMTGSILFIVAAATSLSYTLTIEQIPQWVAGQIIEFGHLYGSQVFLILSVLIMIVFGAVLEGAPALIIFGPLLTPIAVSLGVNPLHFGTVMVVAMGFGLFAPPFGLGLFATLSITGTRMQDVVKPMGKYFAVLFVTLILLTLVPQITMFVPQYFGFK
jgi:tripartite ATP-independent transporter DctM subunit